MGSGILLSISITDPHGRTTELTITENSDVLVRTGGSRQTKLPKTRRDADDFLWEVEGFVEGWDKNYGEGRVTDPGGWMVLLEKDRRFTTCRGNSRYPADWKQFVELFETFLS